MITCCSGSASIQLFTSADGKRLNPRTSRSTVFISSRLPQSVFRRNHVADGIFDYFTNHVADGIWIILSETTSPMHILMTNLDTEVIQVNFDFSLNTSFVSLFRN